MSPGVEVVLLVTSMYIDIFIMFIYIYISTALIISKDQGPSFFGGISLNSGRADVSCRDVSFLFKKTFIRHVFGKVAMSTWMFPKIGGKTPKSSILIGFSIIFTIHFGLPLLLETPTTKILRISRCDLSPLECE